MELGYLTHIVFRVLMKRGEYDDQKASSYTVQVRGPARVLLVCPLRLPRSRPISANLERRRCSSRPACGSRMASRGIRCRPNR